MPRLWGMDTCDGFHVERAVLWLHPVVEMKISEVDFAVGERWVIASCCVAIFGGCGPVFASSDRRQRYWMDVQVVCL